MFPLPTKKEDNSYQLQSEMDYGQKNEDQLMISKYNDKPPANSLAVTNELGQEFDGDSSV